MISQILLIAALMSFSTSATENRSAWMLREDGIASVRVGMTLSQFAAVLHEKFTIPKEEQACSYVDSASHPDILFMFVNGRLARIDVIGPAVATAKGIRVGDSEERVVRTYGPNLKIEPHAYTRPKGHYLTVKSRDRRYGIRFETDGHKVEMFYAGRASAIQYIEGCE